MIETWLMELLKGFGKLFLNPLLYWALLLVFMTGYFRVKQERENFGRKIFNIFSEWKNTWLISIGVGIFLSILFLSIGFVFTYESLLVLSIVVIILSITFRTSLLSASYTIGITYLVLLISPHVLKYQTLIRPDIFGDIHLVGFSILIGYFLLVEAILISKMNRNETYPALALSERGAWIGLHHLKKVSMIPFFVLIPSGPIVPFADYWPYLSFGDQTYSLMLFPFIIGFDHAVRGEMVDHVAKKLSKHITTLAIIVLLIAIGSLYVPWLSLVAVMLAILGREYITYKQRISDNEKTAYFTNLNKGIKVLAVIPGSSAERLNILAGEVITKVNGIDVNNPNMFYEALQQSGAFFKLEVIDDREEVRFIQSAFYEDDHHKLGLVFVDQPRMARKVVP